MGLLDKYEVVSRLKANNKIPVTKYRSARTGLTVTVAQVDGPVVNGYFCLATEAHDDDGADLLQSYLIYWLLKYLSRSPSHSGASHLPGQ